MFCEKLKNYSNFFAQEKGLKLTFKNFELYKLQLSRLLHFRSSREATKGIKKKLRNVFFLGFYSV